MPVVFERTRGLTEKEFHFCPGCTHGVIHRLVAEVLEEMNELGNTVGVAPVGCSVLSYQYFNCDMHEAAHGRAPAMATGIKRVLPDSMVFAYQGDGDLASIGTAEIIHAAGRGEKITVIFVNNAIYGMTGGQMAPTTLAGQRTTTSPLGRDPRQVGFPLRVSEMLATIDGAAFIERTSVHDPAHIRKTKKAIRNAFECQKANQGFSMVEILSTCPTNWGMSPLESLDWVKETMMPYYPLGNFRRPEAVTVSGASGGGHA